MRQIAHYVDQLICYIGYLFPLWDDKRQTIADKLMTTVCVPLNAQPPTAAATATAVLSHRKALTPVSASPMTNWCTSDVPS